jgi:hypothetical protein
MRFSTSDFFIKQLPLGNRFMDLSLFEYGLEFAKIFDYEIADFRKSCVSDRCAQKDPLVTPIFFVGMLLLSKISCQGPFNSFLRRSVSY